MVFEKISRKGGAIIGWRQRKESRVVSRAVARFIGAVALVLMAGSSAFGQFIIQPLKLEAQGLPNKRFRKPLMIENLNDSAAEYIDLRIVDITQTDDGVWEVIEPDDPNASALERSCVEWLQLEEEAFEVNPRQKKDTNLWIKIPPGRRGNYFAGILASTRPRMSMLDGYNTALIFQFLVPVILEVQGRPMRDEVSLTDAGLVYEDQTDMKEAATYVTMGVKNSGGTYARLKGVARVWTEQGGHWRLVTETDLPERSILPGAAFTMKQNVNKALARGRYKVQAYLYVDEQRGDQLAKEFEFDGDRRYGVSKSDAVLTLDPPEVHIQAMPRAMRQGRLTVHNASEEEVNVDVETVIPRQMKGLVTRLDSGQSLRGEQLSAKDWLEIKPEKFTLRPYARQNIRVIARMPEEAAVLPYHYATLKLHASYEDGQLAGTEQGVVFVETRGAQARASITPQQFVIKESTGSRYIAVARFSNQGVTHVMPRCHGRLLMDDSGSVRKRFIMTEGDEDRGKFLPFEMRTFTGYLDVSDVAPGVYRLAAILQYDDGEAVWNQQGIEVKDDEKGNRVLEVIGLDAAGGEIPIKL